MNKVEEILKNKIIIIICIIILIGVAVYLFYKYNQGEETYNIDALEEVNVENIDEVETNVENQTIEEEKIAIHITGEVKNAGLLYLNKGARIADAIKEAGGATKNANLDQVNLAYVLEDGQKIYIPNKKEKIQAGAYIITDSGNNVLVEEGKSTTSEKSKGVNGKVNINSANQSELETLQGIGPALAQRIIEYRKENGKFHSIEDIQNVKGIGDSKYSNIKDSICV